MFPYYIVRFKPTSIFSFSVDSCEFPYYIVRFKPYIFFLFFYVGWVFPYYIVRFKQASVSAGLTQEKSFHTTQYDLNRRPVSKPKWKPHGFHTTQYDLNTFFFSFISAEEKTFPYYIVRFKPHLVVIYNFRQAPVSILHSTI